MSTQKYPKHLRKRFVHTGGYALPAAVPSRMDFIDAAVNARVKQHMAAGLPLPVRINTMDVRDFGAHGCGAVVRGTLPGGRACVVVLHFEPWFDLFGRPGQTPADLQREAESREREYGAEKIKQKGRKVKPTSLSVGNTARVPHTLLPWRGAYFYPVPPASLRHYYKLKSDLVEAERSAALMRLATRENAGIRNQALKIFRRHALKGGEWHTLRNYRTDPPSCHECRRSLRQWMECACGSECEQCRRPKWRWANGECTCNAFDRQVHARYNFDRDALLIVADLYESGPRGPIDCMPGRAESNFSPRDDFQRAGDWDDDLALEKTPFFKMTFDLETRWHDGHNDGGAPSKDSDHSHIIIASVVLTTSASPRPLAVVAIVDEKVKPYAEFREAMVAGEYDGPIGYSAGVGADNSENPNFPGDPDGLANARREALSHMDAACPSGWVTIKTPYNKPKPLLQALAAVWRSFDADVLIGYNSQDYDEPFVCHKVRQHMRPEEQREFFNVLSHFQQAPTSAQDGARWIVRNNWFCRAIKVAGQSLNCAHFDCGSFISLDVMLQMTYREHPDGVPNPNNDNKPSRALDVMLQHYRLRGKVATDFTVMQKAWGARDAHRLSWDTWYCVYDSIGTAQLEHEGDTLGGRALFGSYGYCDLQQTLERADGMRIEGAFVAEAAARGYTMSYDTVTEKRKAVGAWVMTPRPGFVAVPLVSFDVNSQYPSEIMADNLSCENVTEDEEAAREASRRMGRPLRRIGANFIEVPDEDPRTHIDGWVVHHEGDGSRYAVIPHVMNFLKEERKQIRGKDLKEMKTALAVLRELDASEERRVEAIAHMCGRIKPTWRLLPLDLAGLDADARAAAFELYEHRLEEKVAAANKRQKAVKVTMNTGYGRILQREGASHDMNNPLMGGTITARSQQVIRLCVEVAQQYAVDVLGVAEEDKLTEEGLLHYYTDTDSLYLLTKCMIPPPLLEKLMNSVGHGPRREAMLEARAIIEPHCFEIQKRMNAALLEEFGPEMTIKYEGIHLESFFQRAKCYESLLVEVVEESPPLTITSMKEIHVTGHDVIKRTISEHMRRYCEWFFLQVFSPDRPRREDPDYYGLAMRVIEDFLGVRALDGGPGKELDPSLICETAVWRPGRCQANVKQYYDRMRARYEQMKVMGEDAPFPIALTAPPEAGSRFKYVMVGGEKNLFINGGRCTLSVGERMEPLDLFLYAREHPDIGLALELDVQYYSQRRLGSVLGPLLSFLPEFADFGAGAAALGQDAKAIQQRAKAATGWVAAQVRRICGIHDIRPVDAKREFKAMADSYKHYNQLAGGCDVAAQIYRSAETRTPDKFAAAMKLDDVAGHCEVVQDRARRDAAPLSTPAVRKELKRLGCTATDMFKSLGLHRRSRRGTAAGELLAEAALNEQSARVRFLRAAASYNEASRIIARRFVEDLQKKREGEDVRMEVDEEAAKLLAEYRDHRRSYVAAVQVGARLASLFEKLHGMQRADKGFA